MKKDIFRETTTTNKRLADKPNNTPNKTNALLRELTTIENSCFGNLDTFQVSKSTVGYSTIKTMLKDATIISGLEDIKRMVLSKPFSIVSAISDTEDSLFDEALEIKKYVEYMFDDGWRLSNNTPLKAFKEMLSCMENEISLTEIVPKIETRPNPDYENKYIVGSWKTRIDELTSEQFQFEEDPYGNVVAIEQNGISLKLDNLYIFKTEGGNSSLYANNPLFDKLYRYWWNKKVAIMLNSSYLEMVSRINVWAELNSDIDTSSAEASTLKTMLENFQKGGRSFFSKDQIDSVNVANVIAGGKNSEFQSYIDYQDSQMRLIIGKALSISQESKQTGARSAEEVRLKDFVSGIVTETRNLLQHYINSQIIPKFVNLNYPDVWQYPKLIFDSFFEEDAAKLRDNLTVANNMRLIDRAKGAKILELLGLPTELFNEQTAGQIVEQIGDVAKDEIEEEEIKEKKIDNKSKPKVDNKLTKKKIDKKDKDVEEEEIRNKTLQEKPQWLPLKYITLSEVQDVAATMDNYVDITVEQAAEVLGKILDDITNIKKIDKILRNFDIAAIDNLKVKYKPTLRNIYKRNSKKLLKQQQAITKEQQTTQIKKLVDSDYTEPKFLIDYVNSQQVPLEMDRALEVEAFKIADEEVRQILEITRDELVAGLQSDVTAKQVQSNIITKVNNRGLTSLTNYQIATNMRTLATTTTNMARQSIAVQNELHSGYVFTAILDDVTTPQCKELDGTVLSANDGRVAQIQPSLHYQCRSLLLPIYSNELFKEAVAEAEAEIGNIDKHIKRGIAETPSSFGGTKVVNTPKVIKEK